MIPLLALSTSSFCPGDQQLTHGLIASVSRVPVHWFASFDPISDTVFQKRRYSADLSASFYSNRLETNPYRSGNETWLPNQHHISALMHIGRQRGPCDLKIIAWPCNFLPWYPERPIRTREAAGFLAYIHEQKRPGFFPEPARNCTMVAKQFSRLHEYSHDADKLEMPSIRRKFGVVAVAI